ncbi:MAG: hypothetical protein NTZ97_02190 [Candidatus Moranbacteria bacterium]|nr:hypothetical protein [Candidatus Moranbacteria bacterium]
MGNSKILGLAFISLMFIGFYLAYLYGRKTKKFRWSEYLAIIILPVIFIIVFALFIDAKIIKLFIISVCVGSVFEYIFGLVYHRTMNKRLWTYDKFSIQGYTSLLSIPLWGIGGVVLWFAIKIAGL